MRNELKGKPEYLIEQPVAKIEICRERLKLQDMPEDEIRSRLARQLSERLLDEMVYVHYCKSRVTGKIYDGYYDYPPHDDPVCDSVFEAYLPQFNHMQQRINYLEEQCKNNKAYEEYYKKYR